MTSPDTQDKTTTIRRSQMRYATRTTLAVLAATTIVAGCASQHGKAAANPPPTMSAASTIPGVTPATTAPDTPVPSGPDMLPVGGTETLGDNSDTTIGTVTVESVHATTRPADPEFGSQPANGWYVIVRIKAAADPAYTSGFNVNELDFYDLTRGTHYGNGNGNAYSALTSSQSNADLTATLAAGETSSGWLAFDVPARHGRIVYSPNSDGQPVAEWSY